MMKLVLFSLVVFAFSGALSQPRASEQNRLLRERAVLASLLAPPYDSNIRPAPAPSRDGSYKTATEVHLSLFLRDIINVDYEKQEMEIDANLRFNWKDARLRLDGENHIVKLILNTDSVWAPVPFFENARESTLVKHDQVTWLYPDGEVEQSSRYRIKLQCNLPDFERSMGVIAKCPMEIGSFTFANDELVFKWDSKKAFWNEELETRKDVRLDNITTGVKSQHTSTGSYSTVNATIFLQSGPLDADSSGLYKRILLPQGACLLLASLAFLVDPLAAVGVRALILGTSVITTIAASIGEDKATPLNIDGDSTLDCWYTACFVFLAAAILEFAFANFLAFNTHRDAEELAKLEAAQSNYQRPLPPRKWIPTTPARLLDAAALIIYTAAFLLYIIIVFMV